MHEARQGRARQERGVARGRGKSRLAPATFWADWLSTQPPPPTSRLLPALAVLSWFPAGTCLGLFYCAPKKMHRLHLPWLGMAWGKCEKQTKHAERERERGQRDAESEEGKQQQQQSKTLSPPTTSPLPCLRLHFLTPRTECMCNAY